ncbi:MAG: HipA domain-containing protein [Algicola sp.]|nr:HipA domain-containing protein [Algicola sp.]
MNNTHCLITLESLKNANAPQPGYSTQGLKALVGNKKVQMQLPFTRQQFVVELPQRQQGLSMSGYQPKLSLAINQNQFCVVDTFGTYILKPSPEAYPNLAENEHAVMTVMKRLGFDIPPFGLVRFKTTEPDAAEELAFIIKRFDRVQGHKHHQEQLDGAMAAKDKYGNVDGEQAVSYEQAGRFLIDTVDSSLAFKKDLFLRIVYAYLLANNDLHLRNFAILVPETAKNTLAPIYDYISTVPYPAVFQSGYLALPLLITEENDGELAKGFDSAYGQYIGYDFIELAKGFGLNEKLVTKMISQVVLKASLVVDTLRESHMPHEQSQAVIECFKHRLGALQVFEL